MTSRAGGLAARRCAARGAARETTTVSGTSRRGAHELASRAAGGPSESKTTRRGWRCDALDAGGELRVVGERGADARRRPRRPCARQRCARSRLASRRRSTSSRRSRVATLPSSVIADLKSTHGRPVRACLRNAWLSSRARRGDVAVGHVDLDALVAQDAQAAARRPSRSGRRRRRRRARSRPRRSRRCRAASCPCGSTAPGTRRASRRSASPPQAAMRVRPRRAGRRRPRASPRRAPRRRARPPRRRAGSGARGRGRCPASSIGALRGSCASVCGASTGTDRSALRSAHAPSRSL